MFSPCSLSSLFQAFLFFLILVSSSCCVLLCSFPILCPLWFPPLCSLAISCPPHFMPPAFFPHFKTLSSIISTLNTFHHSCISLTTFRTFLRSTSSLPPVFPHYKPTTSLPNLILTTPPPTRYSTRPPSHTPPPPSLLLTRLEISSRRQARFAKNMGLSGVLVWTVDTDDFHPRCYNEDFHLLRSMKRALDAPADEEFPVRALSLRPLLEPLLWCSTLRDDGVGRLCSHFVSREGLLVGQL